LFPNGNILAFHGQTTVNVPERELVIDFYQKTDKMFPYGNVD